MFHEDCQPSLPSNSSVAAYMADGQLSNVVITTGPRSSDMVPATHDLSSDVYAADA